MDSYLVSDRLNWGSEKQIWDIGDDAMIGEGGLFVSVYEPLQIFSLSLSLSSYCMQFELEQ